MNKREISKETRANIIAGSITNILCSIDLMILDDENIKMLKKFTEFREKQLDKAYALPFSDCSKVDKVKLSNDVAKAIYNLCKCRKDAIGNCKKMKLNFESDLDEIFLDHLGLE